MVIFRYLTYYHEVKPINPWSSSRPVPASGSDQGNGPHFRSRPTESKERVEAPWTFSPSEATGFNDEYGGADDYGGGDDHITDDFEPPIRGIGPRTPPPKGDESPLHKPSSMPSLGLSLPKPVPSLPKPVPTRSMKVSPNIIIYKLIIRFFS